MGSVWGSFKHGLSSGFKSLGHIGKAFAHTAIFPYEATAYATTGLIPGSYMKRMHKKLGRNLTQGEFQDLKKAFAAAPNLAYRSAQTYGTMAVAPGFLTFKALKY